MNRNLIILLMISSLRIGQSSFVMMLEFGPSSMTKIRGIKTFRDSLFEEMDLFGLGLLAKLFSIGLADDELFGCALQLAAQLTNKPAFHAHDDLDFCVQSITTV